MYLELKPMDASILPVLLKCFIYLPPMLNVLKVSLKKILLFLFFPFCKEKVKGRMGRTAEKRERRGEAEATGEERKRGDSWDRRINALRILLVSRGGV